MRSTPYLGIAVVLAVLLPMRAHGSDPEEVLNYLGDGSVYLQGPGATAVDPDGNLYVADENGNTVFRVAPGDSKTVVLDGSQSPAFDAPRALATDPTGNLYLASWGSNNVIKRAPDGSAVEFVSSASGALGLIALERDTSGNLYMAGYSSDSVHKVTPEGVVTLLLAGYPLDGPRDIAVAADGTVYVGSFENDFVVVLSPDVPPTVQVLSSSLLNGPRGLAIGPDGDVYVSSFYNNRLLRISGTTFTRVVRDEPEGLRLLAPTSVAVDSRGRIYVAGQDSDNVLAIDEDGNVFEVIDEQGAGPNASPYLPSFDRPVSISTFEDYAFVSAYYSVNVFRVGLPEYASPPYDRFVLYKAKIAVGAPKFSRLGPLVLADQFETVKQDVVKPKVLALPANTSGEGLKDPDTHLMQYLTKNKTGEPPLAPVANAHIQNPCSDTYVEVSKPAGLLVPSAKSLSGPVGPPGSPTVDHFRCFKVKQQTAFGSAVLPGFPRGTQLVVKDQFHPAPARYDLKKLSRLCAPVAKSIDPLDPPLLLAGPQEGQPVAITPAAIGHPAAHLVCYKAKLATKLIAQQANCGAVDPADKGTPIEPPPVAPPAFPSVHVNNQLGPLVLSTGKVEEICIPSTMALETPSP